MGGDRGVGPGSGTMASIQLRDEDDAGYTLVDTARLPRQGFSRGGPRGRYMHPSNRGRGGARFQPGQRYIFQFFFFYPCPCSLSCLDHFIKFTMSRTYYVLCYISWGTM